MVLLGLLVFRAYRDRRDLLDHQAILVLRDQLELLELQVLVVPPEDLDQPDQQDLWVLKDP
jgi:hypothetical protein